MFIAAAPRTTTFGFTHFITLLTYAARLIILWRTHRLLGKDLETDNKTAAVVTQQRGKHASTSSS
jgi:hypothetical protein